MTRRFLVRTSFSQKVAEGGDGVGEEHTRAREAHDGANGLALRGRVAVDGARVAILLLVHLQAALRALCAVRIELGACGAQGLPAYCTGLMRLIFMVCGAVQRDHLGNRPLLALSPFSGFRCVFHG